MTAAADRCPLQGLGPGGLPPALPPGSLPAPVWTSPGRPATQSPRAGGEPDSGVESAPTDQTLRDLHLGIAWRHPQEVTAAAPPPASGRSARVPRPGTASWALLPTWPGFELSWHSRVTVPIVTADSGTGRALGPQRPGSVFELPLFAHSLISTAGTDTQTK